MNKTDFIKAVAAKADLSIKDATAAVEAYGAVIADALKAGDKVAIASFGTYELKHKPERTGFNPITKETIVKIRQSVQGSVQLNLKSKVPCFGRALHLSERI